jgi:GTPase SAR1 family protein
METIKCAIIGDHFSGKQSLLHSYIKNKMKANVFAFKIMIKEKEYNLDLVNAHSRDTNNLDDNDYTWLSNYKADVFLICFSVVGPSTFLSIEEKWVPALKENCGKKIPFILVGTQIELREDQNFKYGNINLEPISFYQGNKLSKELGAFKYVEFSSKLSEVCFFFCRFLKFKFYLKQSSYVLNRMELD